MRAKRVINAAGAWSPEVARLVGVELPNQPHRHEILSTEPLKPFLTPMVSVLSSGLYFSQSMRGEIVSGITVEDHDDGRSSWARACSSWRRWRASWCRWCRASPT